MGLIGAAHLQIEQIRSVTGLTGVAGAAHIVAHAVIGLGDDHHVGAVHGAVFAQQVGIVDRLAIAPGAVIRIELRLGADGARHADRTARFRGDVIFHLTEGFLFFRGKDSHQSGNVIGMYLKYLVE